MAIETAIALYRAGNWSEFGDWLDESGNGYDFALTDLVFTPQAAPDLAYFTGDGITSFMRYTLAGAEMDPGVGDWTAMIVVRNDNVTDDRIPALDTKDDFTIANGWQVIGSTNDRGQVRVADGAAFDSDLTPNNTLVDDTIHAVTLRLDRTAEEVEVFVDGTGTGSPGDTTGQGSIDSAAAHLDVFRVGATFYDGDVFAIAIWDSALSDADIVTAESELQTLIPSVRKVIRSPRYGITRMATR